MPILISGVGHPGKIYTPTESDAGFVQGCVVGRGSAGGDTSSAFAEILWKRIVGNRGGDEWNDNAVDGRSVCS